MARSRSRAVLALLLGAVLGTAGCGGGATSVNPTPETNPKGPPEGVPQVTPQPLQMDRLGDDVPVSGKVDLVVDEMVDPPTLDLAVRTLRQAGAGEVHVRQPGHQDPDATLRVRLGNRVDGLIVKGLQELGYGAPYPMPPEGYVVAGAADASTLVVGGSDPAGVYYGVQTLRQLVTPGKIAGVGVVDHPLMPSRGVVEGFYGSPWTHRERMEQLAFLGDVKMNTYVYSPKDDPYLRDRWRDPYPPERFREVQELIQQAQNHHVRFTYAVSPGPSVCFGEPGDWQALTSKMQAMYDAGVRDFALPFDDITYDRWNCPQDQARYGPPSPGAAGRAQTELLNRVQREFLDRHGGSQPLQTVPTEYSDTADTPYKAALRELDPRVQTLFTGDGVVPRQITKQDARRAAAVWGRKPLLWDNFPVNDFDRAQGRLLLGPYDRRQPGLSLRMVGDVVNPMNQAAASRVAEFGAADFAWNDAGFDVQRSWGQAAQYLAGRRTGVPADPRTAQALRAFFDLNALSPQGSGRPWQGPAPELARRLDEFRAAFGGPDRQGALDRLREDAQVIAEAPARIRAGAAPDFVADSGPWLQATEVWGRSLLATVDGLQARASRDEAKAQERFATAAALAQQAGQVPTVPGENRTQGPARVGDGVLDVFIGQAPGMR